MQLLFIELVATAFMTGLIWIVQLVHYPSFIYIAEADFTVFEKFHQEKITRIVLPVMVIELASALWLLILNPEITAWVSLCAIILIWLTTFFLNVPCHNALGQSKDLHSIRRLVRTNWLRTVLWSLRTILLSAVFYSYLN